MYNKRLVNQIWNIKQLTPILTPFYVDHNNDVINSTALSAATMTPNCGFTVNGFKILASTTCRFSIPITVVFVSTHSPSLQLLLQ